MRSIPHPPALVEAIRSAGLFGVFQIGMMTHDAGLISAFVERWHPETHTFHFSFGEATITLEDVYYILGLPVGGYPVFTEEGLPDASLVLEVLGVDPNIVDEERSTATTIQKGGINILWLVNNFVDCARIEYGRDDYKAQLLFHRYAHILILLGSLFPHSSGNRLPLRLIHYVCDLDRVSQYSWGSACLAYLYKHLCDTSIGKKIELCGSMTLLQVWIYEHFPGLCPTHRQSYLIHHPRALRFFRIPLKYANVPFKNSRGTRFELDSMSESGFKWRPYLDSAPEAMSITDREREVMSAQCPLIFERVVEWCYTDRVTRQFGFL
ncbi:PMD domain-containing protein [Heracleum sosnowskyi]|uniref:PMD domain-containing protein n=1 Tax=Heracleum sosnowskyi TaxID=360622 RepID=A0AAD8MKE4_9APIA|nr:PMD domain-containing protein [Heracleum sosnowskyi]